MIYMLSVIPEGFRELVIPENASYADYDCLRWAGQSKAPTWTPPNLVWLEDDFTSKSDKVGDFTKFGGGAIVLSPKAREVIESVVGDQAEFLPTKGPDNDEWWLLNITNVLDIMDVSKSKFEIYEDGEIGLCEHAHLNEPVPSQKAFVVKGYAPYLFVNEDVKSAIDGAGLTGSLVREYLNP